MHEFVISVQLTNRQEALRLTHALILKILFIYFLEEYMTFSTFKNDYTFRFVVKNVSWHELLISSVAIRNSDNKTMASVETKLNIHEVKDWLDLVNNGNNYSNFTWDDLLESTKRSHLDYFAQRARVQDFFPLNSDTDITGFFN